VVEFEAELRWRGTKSGKGSDGKKVIKKKIKS
jgi:hypothetical protein